MAGPSGGPLWYLLLSGADGYRILPLVRPAKFRVIGGPWFWMLQHRRGHCRRNLQQRVPPVGSCPDFFLIPCLMLRPLGTDPLLLHLTCALLAQPDTYQVQGSAVPLPIFQVGCAKRLPASKQSFRRSVRARCQGPPHLRYRAQRTPRVKNGAQCDLAPQV